ncbi:MAG: hypothetical protein ACR2H0_06605, partial [Candidatus Limnocylindrales bacterium]
VWRNDEPALQAIVDRAVPVLQEPQHAGTLPQVWDLRTWLAMLQGDYESARRTWGAATAALTELGDAHLAGAWKSIDAEFAAVGADVGEARRLAGESLAAARAASCRSCEAVALMVLGVSGDSAIDDEGGPLPAVQKAVAWTSEIEEVSGTVFACQVFAALVAPSDPRLAARVMGAYEALRRRTGHLAQMPGRTSFAEQPLTAARAALGDAEWDAELAAGARIPYRGLLDLILSYREPSTSPGRG